MLFLVSIFAAFVILHALPQRVDACPEAAQTSEILVATVPLVAGALLRAQDVTWQAIARDAEAGEIVRPSAAARAAKPEVDEEARAEVFGAALSSRATRSGVPASSSPAIATSCRSLLSPGARAISIPVASVLPHTVF